MHSFRTTIAIAIGTVALAGGSQAWLLEFWGLQRTCAKINDANADCARGGIADQSNECMMIAEGMKAMLVTDWDDDCRILLWPDVAGMPCTGTPFYNMSRAEVKSPSDSVCEPGFRQQLGAASYICSSNLTSGDGTTTVATASDSLTTSSRTTAIDTAITLTGDGTITKATTISTTGNSLTTSNGATAIESAIATTRNHTRTKATTKTKTKTKTKATTILTTGDSLMTGSSATTIWTAIATTVTTAAETSCERRRRRSFDA